MENRCRAASARSSSMALSSISSTVTIETNERAPAKTRQKAPRGAVFPPGRFAFRARSGRKRPAEPDGLHGVFWPRPSPLPSDTSTHSIKSSPVSIGPARSIKARMTSDLGTLRRRAHRAKRAARALSSFTVIVGMVIPRYYQAASGVKRRGPTASATDQAGVQEGTAVPTRLARHRARAGAARHGRGAGHPRFGRVPRSGSAGRPRQAEGPNRPVHRNRRQRGEGAHE